MKAEMPKASLPNNMEERRAPNVTAALVSPYSNPHRLMDQIVAEENVKKAVQKVWKNNGRPGIDRVTVRPPAKSRNRVHLKSYMDKNWTRIKTELLEGQYTPSPVRRVLIDKYGSNKKRALGIPTAIDRVIQQATLQGLQPIFNPHFSDYSFGYRPKPDDLGPSEPRTPAHRALLHMREVVSSGYGWIASIDLESFFDTVNHDLLMARVARRVEDGRVLRTIRRYLRAEISFEGGLLPSQQGTPQGGPLSPLLSNILLDDLDRTLEARGHQFCRYADDFIIMLKSAAAAERVKRSVENYLTTKLKLKVNQSKSKIVGVDEVEYLGHGLTGEETPRFRVSNKSLKKLGDKVRGLQEEAKKWARRRREDKNTRIYLQALSDVLRGWYDYFQMCTDYGLFRDLDDEELRTHLLTQLDSIDAINYIRRRGETSHEMRDETLLHTDDVASDCPPYTVYSHGGRARLLQKGRVDCLRDELVRGLNPPTPATPRVAASDERRGRRAPPPTVHSISC
ncbi:MAG: group II intron reverse transcriptase/maturase [Candidatus Fermentibacteraceae bacterium]